MIKRNLEGILWIKNKCNNLNRSTMRKFEPKAKEVKTWRANHWPIKEFLFFFPVIKDKGMASLKMGEKKRNSLVFQWLGLHVFTSRDQVWCLVEELRSHKLCSMCTPTLKQNKTLSIQDYIQQENIFQKWRRNKCIFRWMTAETWIIRIISIDAQEAPDKILHLFMIKTLTSVSIEGTYLNTIKTIYNKPT